MEPILQFDPANMSVWAVRLPPAQGRRDVIAEVAEPALLGDHATARVRTLAMPEGADRARAAHVLSSVWHEQRHFVDVLLTNYGQSLVRTVTSVAINIPGLAAEALPSGRIALPLTVYGDDVLRRIVDVEPGETLVRQVRDMTDRRRMLDLDRRRVHGGLSIGGQAQLEVLGFFTQVVAAQHELGFELASAVQRDVLDREHLRRRYQWAGFLAPALATEIDPAEVGRELADDEQVILAPPLIAFLYGTLMIRRWGQDQTVVDGGDSGSAAARLDPLFVELRRTGVLAAATSSAEAWAAVDGACADIFGRSATDELRADLEHEGAYVERLESAIGADTPMFRFVHTAHRARRALADAFMTDPELFISSERYSDLLETIQPVPILVDLAGADPEARPGWEPLWEGRAALGAFGEQSWSWASAPTDVVRATGRIGLAGDAEAWSAMVRDFLPMAKLMLHGRRQAPILGPELDHAELRLRSLGLEARFDPLFADPTIDASADAFWFLTGSADAVCDACNAPLVPGQGHYVGAVAFHRNAELRQWLVEHYGGGELGLFSAKRNWTGWLLCDGCCEEVKALGAALAPV
jgi:hypothetical protein